MPVHVRQRPHLQRGCDAARSAGVLHKVFTLSCLLMVQLFSAQSFGLDVAGRWPKTIAVCLECACKLVRLVVILFSW